MVKTIISNGMPIHDNSDYVMPMFCFRINGDLAKFSEDETDLWIGALWKPQTEDSLRFAYNMSYKHSESYEDALNVLIEKDLVTIGEGNTGIEAFEDIYRKTAFAPFEIFNADKNDFKNWRNHRKEHIFDDMYDYLNDRYKRTHNSETLEQLRGKEWLKDLAPEEARLYMTVTQLCKKTENRLCTPLNIALLYENGYDYNSDHDLCIDEAIDKYFTPSMKNGTDCTVKNITLWKTVMQGFDQLYRKSMIYAGKPTAMKK